MAHNGCGLAAGHIGRIPNYGKTQVNPMGNYEPPACIQNAMMTKDKKPFTYTPGGLDLSQIRKPSMARRLARQRSDDQEVQAPQQNGSSYHRQGGPAPPPPPPPKMPAPPPPPPIVIEVPNSKLPKPIVPGERPEIVIPENPIGMLRKTNSPYHWETENAEIQKLGNTPRFVEKKPSPLTVQMPPSSFSKQAPQSYTPAGRNYYQPESPIHKPEAQYAHQNSPGVSGSPPTRELLQRQDSQFNNSPQPFAHPSPVGSSSPYSPTPNNNWRQPEKRDSPASIVNNSPQFNRGPFLPSMPQYSPNVQTQGSPINSSPGYHTLPRSAQKIQDNTQNNNVIYNNTRDANVQSSPNNNANTAPWRTATLNKYPREPEMQQKAVNNNQQYVPPWKTNEVINNNENSYIPPWQQENKPQQQYSPPSIINQDTNNNVVNQNVPWRTMNNVTPSSPPQSNQSEPRYQSSMSIPVTPRKPNPQPEYNNTPPQKEVVYVNQEPVFYCPDNSQTMPPWVKTQKEKTKTPPPVWCQKPLDGRKSLPRELVTPPRETGPEWVKKSNDIQRGAREVVSPPKYHQQGQPTWSTMPSENRKSLPRDNAPRNQGSRVIPIQMEVSSTETRDGGRPGQPHQLRIIIGMNESPQEQARAPFSPPTQRIMRVLSPQLVRMDEAPSQPDLPSLNRTFQNVDIQPKTRIIPIQIEGGNSGPNKSFGGRY